MGRFLVLAGLALLTAAEVAAVLWLVGALGPVGALTVLCLDMLAGVLIMRWGLRGPDKERGWRLAAGAVIALPGLVLDLVGLALLVPSVRTWLQGTVLRGTESALRRRGVSVVTVTDASGAARTTVVPGDVITGEVVTDPTGSPASSPDSTSPDPAAFRTTKDPGAGAPGSGPSVVRGELAGPDEV